MPGVDLDLDLPSLSDSLATIVSKTVDALQAIEDDLAAQVVSSEININAALSFNGAAITNLGSATFSSGNIPTTAGSVWYDGTEWYVSDATGTIQVTSNGSLNIAAVGGIVGDYGGGNPARVTYDDASGEYRFTEDTGVYADLVADDLVLHSASGSVRFSVDDAITTDRQFIIEDLPTAGVSALVYDASDSSVKSAENTRVTNALKITTLDMTGEEKHGDRSRAFILAPTYVVSGGAYTPSIVTNGIRWGLGSTSVVYCELIGFRKGDRIKTLRIRGQAFTFEPTITVLDQQGDAAVVKTYTTSGNFIVAGNVLFTLDSPIVMGNNSNGQSMLIVKLSGNGASTSSFWSCDVTYDRP